MEEHARRLDELAASLKKELARNPDHPRAEEMRKALDDHARNQALGRRVKDEGATDHAHVTPPRSR